MENWYQQFKNTSLTKEAKEQDYGWVSISVPKYIADKTISFSKKIPERELFIKVFWSTDSFFLV